MSGVAASAFSRDAQLVLDRESFGTPSSAVAEVR